MCSLCSFLPGLQCVCGLLTELLLGYTAATLVEVFFFFLDFGLLIREDFNSFGCFIGTALGHSFMYIHVLMYSFRAGCVVYKICLIV